MANASDYSYRKMVWRFGVFLIQMKEKVDILKEYVNAQPTEKKNTRLYKKSLATLEKYPDEDPFFYVPRNQTEGEKTVLKEKVYSAYVETLKLLLDKDEQEELMLLLYRGNQFVSLYFQMQEMGYLDVLYWMMQIGDCYILDEITNPGDWGTWLKGCPEEVKEKLKHAENVGRLISTRNELEYTEFRSRLIAEYGLDIDLGEQNPWSLCTLH